MKDMVSLQMSCREQVQKEESTPDDIKKIRKVIDSAVEEVAQVTLKDGLCKYE